jgi:flavodoxin
MHAEIVYCSHSGNTKRLAEAIADTIGSRGHADVVPVDSAAATIADAVDLLIIGSPTEGHGIPQEMRRFLERLDPESVRGRHVAAFDSRVRWPRILSGSAAAGIAKRLTAKGARLVAPPGSFIVTTEPALEEGELERARAWAAAVADAVTPIGV